MLALREDWYLSPTGGESQGMRDLLRVKLPLSVCVCGGGPAGSGSLPLRFH